MKTSNADETRPGKFIRPGSFIKWNKRIFCVDAWDAKNDEIKVHVYPSGTPEVLDASELLFPSSDDEAPVFANTLGDLADKVAAKGGASQPIVSDGGIPPNLLAKADEVIAVVEFVRKYLHARSTELGAQYRKKPAIEEALRLLVPNGILKTTIVIATYYNYETVYRECNGQRARIALQYRRRNAYGQYKLTSSVIHLVEICIDYYHPAKKKRNGLTFKLKAASIYRQIDKLLKRTKGQWVDFIKCKGSPPQALVAELMDKQIPIERILNNPEKSSLLTHVKRPSKSWFHGHYAYYVKNRELPGEDEYLLRYGHRVQTPLGLVYLDEHKVKVYAVDDETRSELLTINATFAFDMQSRALMAVDLYAHASDLEVLLSSMRQTIYPVNFATTMGVKIVFPWGIPVVWSLDNTFTHLHPQLEELARAVSQDGEYTKMDFMFRPPRQPKKGGVIERALGDYAAKFHELFDFVDISIKGQHTTSPSKLSRFIVNDIKQIVIGMGQEYNYTIHSETGQRPIERYMEGIQQTMGRIIVPPLTPALDRMFMPCWPKTKKVFDNSVSFLGLEYKGLSSKEMPERDFTNKPIPYSIHYTKNNISKISLIHNGVWIGDLVATRFLLPDGRVRPVSMLEQTIARKLAIRAGQSATEWPDFVGAPDPEEISQLDQRRHKEQAQIQKYLSSGLPSGDTSGDETSASISYENYWDTLSGALQNFSSSG